MNDEQPKTFWTFAHDNPEIVGLLAYFAIWFSAVAVVAIVGAIITK